LICAGAFDSLPGNRAQKHTEIAAIIEKAVSWKRDAATGQMGLFSGAKKSEDHDPHIFEPFPDWQPQEKLEKEKEVIGFYLSSHPLQIYETQLRRFAPLSFAQALEKGKAHTGSYELVVLTAGLLKKRKDIVTKKGDRMAFIELEDMSGHAEIVIFPRTFAKASGWLDHYQLFVVKGTIDPTSTTCKIKANEIVPIELVLHEWPTIEKITLTLPETFEQELLQSIQETLVAGKSPLSITFQEHGKKLLLETKKTVACSPETLEILEKANISIAINL
jgi:DNA polymerase-3 subunit alpha